MLAVKTYPTAYIDASETRVHALLDAFDTVAKKPPGAAGIARLEQLLCHEIVVVLDACFMHRTRAVEGKDGNPLNEVRMLAASIQEHQSVLVGDKTIRYDPIRSVLALAIGDKITINRDQIGQLATAYFAEIRARFT